MNIAMLIYPNLLKYGDLAKFNYIVLIDINK